MTVQILSSLSSVEALDWDGALIKAGAAGHPFLSHAFLSALEESGSATARTGWRPSHVIMRDGDEIAALAPCYQKSHSQGEYVFDHGWAQAFERAGGRYYPKLQVSVPFTPATGPRLVAATPALRAQLASVLIDQCQQSHASSIHVTFAEPPLSEELASSQWLLREDIQFHWRNPGFRDFDEFLATLSSAKRKAIRKERKAVSELGISFECLTGADIKESHWDQFFEFYMDTGSRKWGRPYLTRAFFSLVGARMPDNIVLIMAKRNGRAIAGALNFMGNGTLYGRNWGCLEHHPFLHFETCYYQAQDFAIAHGLKTVEAGAQGEHKLARGYEPVKTQSHHYLAHAGLRRAVGEYLEQERAAVSRDQSLLSEHTPFRKPQPQGEAGNDL